jgi:hypothetical protein
MKHNNLLARRRVGPLVALVFAIVTRKLFEAF